MTDLDPGKVRDAKALMVLIANKQALERGALAMWTIYDKPNDCPDGYVARLHELIPGGETRPTGCMHVGELMELRAVLWKAGMLKRDRDEKDDPCIVESWV